MKAENIQILGKVVVGLTAGVSTILAGVSHYYLSNLCLSHFAISETNIIKTDNATTNISYHNNNLNLVLCYTTPIITDFTIISSLTQLAGMTFFGTSFRFWQPFANMLNAGGIASCLNSENAANDEHFTTSSITQHSTQGSINEWLSNVELHQLSNNDNLPACESFTDSIERNVDLPDAHATNFQQDPLSTLKTIEASGESTTALEPLVLP